MFGAPKRRRDSEGSEEPSRWRWAAPSRTAASPPRQESRRWRWSFWACNFPSASETRRAIRTTGS